MMVLEEVSLLSALSLSGAAIVLITFFVKTITPLRLLAMLSNVIFIIYAIILGSKDGFALQVLSLIILHGALLPLNAFRLFQMQRLIRQVSEATTNQDIVKYLIPFMEKEKLPKGTVVFHKGDNADKMFVIQTGKVKIPEIGKTLDTGSVFGEVGIFSPRASRTAGAICTDDCELFSIKQTKLLELYYQNPGFGFFIVRILSDHIDENVNALLELQQRS